MINDKNILSHEIIGLQAKIEESCDRTLTGMSGLIMLETKNMIAINTDKGLKHIPKLAARKIKLELPRCSCIISGSSLRGRPEDRVKASHRERYKNG
jgi:ribonuclease P protein subunit POP4